MFALEVGGKYFSLSPLQRVEPSRSLFSLSISNFNFQFFNYLEVSFLIFPQILISNFSSLVPYFPSRSQILISNFSTISKFGYLLFKAFQYGGIVGGARGRKVCQGLQEIGIGSIGVLPRFEEAKKDEGMENKRDSTRR